MNTFFQNVFPIRLRPAFAFDYVLAYTNDVERECLCDTPIEVSFFFVLAPIKKSVRLTLQRVQPHELCIGQWAHMSTHLGPLSYMQWRHVHWCAKRTLFFSSHSALQSF